MIERDDELRSESLLQEAMRKRLAELEERMKSGANWFYWIAALSVVNSVIVMAEGNWSFIVGLGVTQIVDGMWLGIVEEAPELKTVATVVAILVNLISVTICALFGFFAGKKKLWAFWIGMVLYGLDGLIFVAFADYFSAGFHVFALWYVYGGLRALQEIRATEENQDYGTVSPD